MSRSVDRHYQGLWLPPGVALARPVSRKGTALPVRLLLVGDGLASALAPALRRVLEDQGSTMVGPASRPPEGTPSPTHVVFAFERAPAGAPPGWQVPLANQYRSPSVKLLWLDLAPVPTFNPKVKVRMPFDLLRPSEAVLRRSYNGLVSTAGMAGVASLVRMWAQSKPAKQPEPALKPRPKAQGPESV